MRYYDTVTYNNSYNIYYVYVYIYVITYTLYVYVYTYVDHARGEDREK